MTAKEHGVCIDNGEVDNRYEYETYEEAKSHYDDAAKALREHKLYFSVGLFAKGERLEYVEQA